MNQEQKSVEKRRSEEHVAMLRKVGRVKEEVIALVEEDLKYGLSIEQTNHYMKSDMDISQMRIYSRCLRSGFSEEATAVITAKGLSGYQMTVAYEFYDKGVPLESIKAVAGGDETPAAMKAAYQKVLDAMKKQNIDEREVPEYVESLMEEIRNVVSKIDFQEKRYDALNEKLKIFERTKLDEEVREGLVKSLTEKDQLLEEQQDKLNQANSAIARLRAEMEGKEKELKNLQVKVSDLETDAGIKEKKVQKLNTELVEGENRSILGRKEAPFVNVPKNTSAGREGTMTGQVPYVYGVPVFNNAAFVDAGGNVVQIQPAEREEKKTGGVVSRISRLAFKKRSRQDIVKLVAAGELIPEQLMMIRTAIEKGLKENQLIELINSKVPAEHMKEIIEIAVLENGMEA